MRWEVRLMDLDPKAIDERLKGTLSDLLGVRFVEATPERVVAELTYREALTTIGGSLHGGTLMAFADTIGARGHRAEPAAGRQHDHARVEDQLLRRRARRHGARGVHATAPRQAHDGLADAGHRRGRASAVADHPDADGPGLRYQMMRV